jgi:RNA polymerase sigma-70 factor, ECF subfamily
VACVPVPGYRTVVGFVEKSHQFERGGRGRKDFVEYAINPVFGIKQTLALIHPHKQKQKRCKMTQSSLTLKDNTLVELALAGQTECFSVLINRHAAMVRNHLSRLVRNHSDLDDIVQDAFTKAWTRLSTFRFEANFRTWLMSIALNEALTLYRRRKCGRLWPGSVNLEARPSQCESPYQIFARTEDRLRVRTAVKKLPRKYREALVLCDLEQLSVRETAKRMNASIPLVKTRLFRARQMLAVALNQRSR